MFILRSNIWLTEVLVKIILVLAIILTVRFENAGKLVGTSTLSECAVIFGSSGSCRDMDDSLEGNSIMESR